MPGRRSIARPPSPPGPAPGPAAAPPCARSSRVVTQRRTNSENPARAKRWVAYVCASLNIVEHCEAEAAALNRMCAANAQL